MPEKPDSPIANMEGLQAAIANGEAERLKELLAGQKLDELQKDYLLDLAKLNPDTKCIQLIKDTPVKT